MCGWLVASAQCDFRVADASGVILCYQKMQERGCVRVTHPELQWPYYADSMPSGRIVIPSTVTWEGETYRVVEVGDNAFYGCDSLLGVDFGQVRRIGSQALYGCTMLDSVHLSPFLVEISDGAFAYCWSLRRLVLPDALNRIGTSAFALCTGLEQVVLSPRVEGLCNATTFHGCGWLKETKNRKIGLSGEQILCR